MKNWILAMIGTAAGSAFGVFVWIKAHNLKIVKTIKVSRDVMDILDEGVESSQDGKLTSDEIQKITDLFEKLKRDLKNGGSK